MKASQTKRYPHVVKLPPGSVSPTGSVYGTFDIVRQTKVLNTYNRNAVTIRSAEPFAVQVKLPSGRLRTIESKLG